MGEAVRGSRPVPRGTRVAAVLAAPLAPLLGLLVALALDPRDPDVVRAKTGRCGERPQAPCSTT
jgi:hypothetical protein